VTRQFCTLFDANYLPRALTLYRSLERVSGSDFALHALCMDDRTFDIFGHVDAPQLRPVPLAALETYDPMLLAVKKDRTPVEYCWTSTPALCLYLLERDDAISEITYLDADLMFFSDPEPLFEELADASVLIVPHRYSPDLRRFEEVSGIFNVQFLTFRKTPEGLGTLSWWRERCLEWCGAVPEPGRYGDQKYLDDWPQRFVGVKVLEHPGGGLAPWNSRNYRLMAGGSAGVLVGGRELVFYHYHALRLLGTGPFRTLGRVLHVFDVTGDVVWRSEYRLSSAERELVWKPYLGRLDEAIHEIRSIEPGFEAGFVRPRKGDLRVALGRRARAGLGAP
jgi:hypothetical protein